jgi:nicotinate-nucleotide adenylyltransferase
MRIGLFGGSFNPAHAGHRLVALEALKRLRLDAVWLLVSPGNPLKNHNDLAPLASRVAGANAATHHPRIKATGFEAAHGFRYTYDTLSFLCARYPATRFVWLMGADNLGQFNRWEHWRAIADMLPMAIYVRPGATRTALASIAARALSAYRIDERDAPLLADLKPPAWVYLRGVTSPLSSSVIRARSHQKRAA